MKTAEAKSRPRYASVFWRNRMVEDKNTISANIGWSIPSTSGDQLESGSIVITNRIDAVTEPTVNLLPIVEEAIGIVHPKPSKRQQERDERYERLVADYLLFMMHRAFFGQCDEFFGPAMKNAGTCDVILYFGPILPKFIGRICYSHFTRNKTLAVIAPDCRLHEMPVMSRGLWKAEPRPSFWYDCAVRRWDTDSVETQPPRIASFQIAVPTGDGVSGRLSPSLCLGSTMWKDKAQKIQDILDSDQEKVNYALWSNSDIFLPSGMAKAVRAVVLNEKLKEAIVELDQWEKSAATQDKQLRESLSAAYADRGGNPFSSGIESRGLRALLFVKARAIAQSEKKPGKGVKYLRSEENAKEYLEKAQKQIEAELGKSVFIGEKAYP